MQKMQYYNSNRVLTKNTLNDKNERCGECLEYYYEGGISQRAMYERNQLSGVCIRYYENGISVKF